MNDDKLNSPTAIRAFLGNTSNVEFQIPKDGVHLWVADRLRRTGYLRLPKRDKSIVREYMQRMTGYSWSQLKRFIAQYKSAGKIERSTTKRNTFARRYTREDILLLAQNDEAHQDISGPAMRKLFERAYNIYKDPAYERLSTISVSHIYNLRHSNTYQCQRRHFTKTQSTKVKIGTRKKPRPEGQPGFIRIDTVHQGDQDKKKGVYHINAVDEVTQYEVVFSVKKISERYLIPVLEELLNTFPFVIINFHSDNGSEYINTVVADLLNKLHIEMTKSRSRQSNDNALAESKNGSIIRKYFGYQHIEQRWAPVINVFNKMYLTPYLNLHRPCFFSEIKVDVRGKEKKIYPLKQMMTPYEKFKSLENAKGYLKPGVTFEMLDEEMLSKSDLQAAKEMRQAQIILFKRIFESPG